MTTAFTIALCVAMSPATQTLDLQLPTNPRAWINSPAVSVETLKGKGVVFYFFEET